MGSEMHCVLRQILTPGTTVNANWVVELPFGKGRAFAGKLMELPSHYWRVGNCPDWPDGLADSQLR